jgi:hypothetical protein
MHVKLLSCESSKLKVENLKFKVNYSSHPSLFRGKVRMGVTVFSLKYLNKYPHPSPPPIKD